MLLLVTSKSRYNRPQLAWTAVVGATSGFLTSLAGIGGPPIVPYQMLGSNPAAASRANPIVFFALTQLIALGAYWAKGGDIDRRLDIVC